MVNEHAYAPTLTETARANIRTAVDALMSGTGLSQTFISRAMNGDSAWVKRLPETSINLRSYDAAMGRLSAMWPDDLPWPASVPRPAPLDLPPEVRADLDSRLINCDEAKAARIAELQAELARLGAPAGGDQAPAQT